MVLKMKVIDLRSDTVTKPCATMRQLMANAEVGDDVYGDDPTVYELQRYAAQLLGKEAAIFASSGTQTNLLALLSHCQRGDEYIVGQQAHTYRYEAGGAAVLGSIQPQPLDFMADGSLDLKAVKQAIKPADVHFARSRLLSLENTVSGKVLPLSYLADARVLCDEHQLALHLDGARVFNAAVAQKVAVKTIAEPFDSVSICLSKGLGAPIGSLLVGSQALIDQARRWRKMLGGGMRQAGIIAAAGLYALQHNVERLSEDHVNALSLATGLNAIDGINVNVDEVQTNVLFVSLPEGTSADLEAFLQRQNIKVSASDTMRLVTHLDISAADVDTVVQGIGEFYSS
ncbi:MAG: threonine aldolase [Phenylobacterium sp.]|jgi:threonine aldolase